MLDEKQYLIQILGVLEDIYTEKKEENLILNNIIKVFIVCVFIIIFIGIIFCIVC